MSWSKQERVRFGHCDPAGIVFYPRYFEMVNALIEDWFTQGLGVNYAQLLGPRRVGVPTVSLSSEFKRISRMGELLTQTVAVKRLGRTSVTLTIEFISDEDGGVRAVFEQVLVCTDLDTHKPQPFPADLRAALENHHHDKQE